MESLTLQIQNGTYPINIEPIGNVINIKKLQIREILRNPARIEWIANQIDKNNGSIEKTRPVIIFEGVGLNNEPIAINGYHTTHGVLASTATTIKTIRVPYSDIKHLTKTEIKAIALDFNSGGEIREGTNTKGDAVKFVVSAWFESSIEPTSQYIKSKLTEWYFSPNEITTIIKNAKHEIDKAEFKKFNSNFIEYSQEQLNIIRSKNTNSTTIAFAFSSGLFRWNSILSMITKDTRLDTDFNKIPNRTNLKIYIHHPNPDAKRKWDECGSDEVRSIVDYVLVPIGYRVQSQELPHLQDNNMIL
jgi:hypothetical protein